MARFRKVDASVLEKPAKRPVGRQPSPEQLALIAKIKTITDPSVVYEVILEGDEKPITVRQQLLRASKAAGVPVGPSRWVSSLSRSTLNPSSFTLAA